MKKPVGIVNPVAKALLQQRKSPQVVPPKKGNKRKPSKKEKQKIIRAKESAGRAGKYKRSSKTNVKGARKKGATLRDWFEKENWINIKTGRPCGESTKKKKKK